MPVTWAKFFFEGPQSQAVVDSLITNSTASLSDNQCLYTPICYPEGGIVDDCLVYRFGQESWMIVVNASNREKDFAWFKENSHSKCKLEDRSDAMALLALQGPQASSILNKVLHGTSEQTTLAHDNVFAMISRVMEGPITPPSAFVDDIPDGVEELTMKALERDPNRRFANALEMGAAIDRVFAKLGGVPAKREIACAVSELYRPLGLIEIPTQVDGPLPATPRGALGRARSTGIDPNLETGDYDTDPLFMLSTATFEEENNIKTDPRFVLASA